MAEGGRSDLVKGLLVGAAIGAVLGILFAPQEGRRTRQELLERTRDLGQAAADLAQRTRGASADAVAGAIEELSACYARLRNFLAEEGERALAALERGREALRRERVVLREEFARAEGSAAEQPEGS